MLTLVVPPYTALFCICAVCKLLVRKTRTGEADVLKHNGPASARRQVKNTGRTKGVAITPLHTEAWQQKTG